MEKHSEIVHVKLTPGLEKQIKDRASELSLPISTYIRMVLTLNLKENERVTA